MIQIVSIITFNNVKISLYNYVHLYLCNTNLYAVAQYQVTIWSVLRRISHYIIITHLNISFHPKKSYSLNSATIILHNMCIKRIIHNLQTITDYHNKVYPIANLIDLFNPQKTSHLNLSLFIAAPSTVENRPP